MGIEKFSLEKDIKTDFRILSAIFDSDSFFYAISDQFSNLVKAKRFQFKDENIPESIEEIRKDLGQLKQYDKINWVNACSRFTCIPEAEYLEAKKELYASLTFKPTGVLQNGLIRKEKIQVVHSLPTYSKWLMNSNQGVKNVFHIVEAWHQLYIEDGLYVFVNYKVIQIYCVYEDRFRYFNFFKYRNTDDILYFVMLAIQQLKLKVESTDVYLSGDKELVTASRKKLEAYVKRILEFEFGFNNIKEKSDLLDLYAASLCE